MFNKLEALREYRNMLALSTEDEKRKLNHNTISALELFKINERRLNLMRNILKPLLLKLQEEINIQNLYFTEGSGDDLYLNIDFSTNDKDGKIILDNSDDDNNIEFVLDTSNGKYQSLINKNCKLIISSFKEGLNSDFDKSLKVTSVSKLFTLSMNFYRYLLESKNNINDNYIKIMYQYYRFGDKKPRFECISSYQDINAFLQDKERLSNYLSHIRFYEEDIPMYLIKKR